eukprot:m.211879 g.211879  ORF g.211879 m.211879 type:complete len:397 (-) comp19030_c0_seq26:1698-2888(-)
MVRPGIVAIPASDIRVIERLTVFKVTSFNSLFAYVWLLIILMGVSKDMVEVWEGVLTLLFFPIMIIVAYLADIGYFDSGRPTGVVHSHPVDRNEDFTAAEAFLQMRQLAKERGCAIKDLPPQVIASAITSSEVGQLHFSRAQHKNNAIRRLTGRQEIIPNTVYTTNAIESALQDKSTTPELPSFSVGFRHVHTSVVENAGSVRLIVDKAPGLKGHKCLVAYTTKEGEAKAGEDFVAQSGTLSFQEDETEQTIDIRILDDDIEEDDETFTVAITDLQCSNPKAYVSETNAVATVVIIDDDHPGVLSCHKQQIQQLESNPIAEVIVVRHGGSKGSITVDYATKSGYRALTVWCLPACWGDVCISTPHFQSFIVPYWGATYQDACCAHSGVAGVLVVPF